MPTSDTAARVQAESFCAVATFSAALSVAAGAFGAHGLEDRVEPRLLEVFETAARYHMYHALGLGMVALFGLLKPQAAISGPAWTLLFGTCVFSGSLYLLVLTNLRWLGAITPIGGLALIVGWVWAGVSFLRTQAIAP